MGIKDGVLSVALMIEMSVAGEEDGRLQEALNFAHAVFKGFFVYMDKTSPF